MLKILLALIFFASPLFSTSTDIPALEKRLVTMVNAHRTKNNLPPLSLWKPLTETARRHSQNMAQGKVPFGHDGFSQRAASLKSHSPLTSLAENVAYNYGTDDPLKTALTGWLNSPSHRKNLLGRYQETGIGIAISPDGHCYLTQLFATRP